MKKKQINKVKVEVFEEKELRENLSLNPEQIKLILDYQVKFPELLQKKEGFCINARNLHSKLEVGAEYTTWIKRRINKYKFDKDVDFTSFDKSVKGKNTYINTTEYLITLNMAKELSMVENNEAGREIRKYFILIENILRDYKEWGIIRGDEKIGWNNMTDCIKDWCIRNNKDYTIRKFYTREANLINQALFNRDAAEINWLLDNDDRITRNHLSTDMNEAILEMQEFNCNLILANMNFEERTSTIQSICKTKYSNLKDELLKIVA